MTDIFKNLRGVFESNFGDCASSCNNLAYTAMLKAIDEAEFLAECSTKLDTE